MEREVRRRREVLKFWVLFRQIYGSRQAGVGQFLAIFFINYPKRRSFFLLTPSALVPTWCRIMPGAHAQHASVLNTDPSFTEAGYFGTILSGFSTSKYRSFSYSRLLRFHTPGVVFCRRRSQKHAFVRVLIYWLLHFLVLIPQVNGRELLVSGSYFRRSHAQYINTIHVWYTSTCISIYLHVHRRSHSHTMTRRTYTFMTVAWLIMSVPYVSTYCTYVRTCVRLYFVWSYMIVVFATEKWSSSHAINVYMQDNEILGYGYIQSKNSWPPPPHPPITQKIESGGHLLEEVTLLPPTHSSRQKNDWGWAANLTSPARYLECRTKGKLGLFVNVLCVSRRSVEARGAVVIACRPWC